MKTTPNYIKEIVHNIWPTNKAGYPDTYAEPDIDYIVEMMKNYIKTYRKGIVKRQFYNIQKYISTPGLPEDKIEWGQKQLDELQKILTELNYED